MCAGMLASQVSVGNPASGPSVRLAFGSSGSVILRCTAYAALAIRASRKLFLNICSLNLFIIESKGNVFIAKDLSLYLIIVIKHYKDTYISRKNIFKLKNFKHPILILKNSINQ